MTPHGPSRVLVIVTAHFHTQSICNARPALPRLRSVDHGADALWIKRPATFVAVAGIIQLDADFAVTQAAGFAFRSPKATRFRNHLWPRLSV